MKKWVGKDIQNRGEGGHDPEEDSRACIDLMKLKVKNGPGYGLFMTDVENILERMGRGECRMSHSVGPGTTMRTAVVDYGNPSTWLGSKATSTVACSSDQDVVQGVRDLIDNHHFVFGRMMELSEALGWTQKKNASNPYATPATNGIPGAIPATPSVQTPHEAMHNAELSLPTESSEPTQDVEEVYKALDENLTAIYQCLPPATAFLLLSGHDDPRKMSEMAAKKTNFENAIKEGKHCYCCVDVCSCCMQVKAQKKFPRRNGGQRKRAAN
jgi:RNA exonuclease 1